MRTLFERFVQAYQVGVVAFQNAVQLIRVSFRFMFNCESEFLIDVTVRYFHSGPLCEVNRKVEWSESSRRVQATPAIWPMQASRGIFSSQMFTFFHMHCEPPCARRASKRQPAPRFDTGQ